MVIPDGEASTTIDITPVDDAKLEDDQTVILTLTADPGYTIGTPDSGTVTIVDNDEVSDGFESGDETGGVGWSGDWTLDGSAKVTNKGTPHSGSYHLREQKGNSVATRTADLSEVSDAHLTFYWKADSFETGDYATVEIYDGNQWHEVLRIEDGDDDDQYHYADIDLSGYTLTADFEIRISSHMDKTNDYFYVDDILIQ